MRRMLWCYHTHSDQVPWLVPLFPLQAHPPVISSTTSTFLPPARTKIGTSLLTQFSIIAGVDHFNVSLETQTADVWALPTVSKLALTSKLIKSGKTMHSGTVDGAEIDLAEAKSYEAPA
jgi:hypothetical protein